MSSLNYNRVIVKFSGEALAAGKCFGIDRDVLDYLTDEIISLRELGLEIGIVVGGGNIYRGVDIASNGMDRVRADYIGMLGTVINGIALKDLFARKGINTKVMSAIRMEDVAEPMVIRKARQYLKEGKITIFTCGTGRPYFSTDSGAAVRASEVEADLFIKGTKVDGVYDKDPEEYDGAQIYKSLDYQTAIDDKLGVMDTTAFNLCQENDIPIMVYNMTKSGQLKNSLVDQNVGTLITRGE